MGMFEILKSTLKKNDEYQTNKSEENSGDDSQNSSQEEFKRDILVDPVIKKLKKAKVRCASHLRYIQIFEVE